MTSHRIGVNLRVSGNCDQGARKYMEDNHVIKFLKKDTDDYEFAYFGIFDGHGGPEASAFCRDNLLNEITKYDGFWTNDDDKVLSAIRKGFLDTHHNMWNVIDTWPKTVTGLQSTAGSTATVAIVKQGKLYTGHVGDSGLVMGENDEYATTKFPVQAICITKEHKPDDPDERLRIEDAGGEVINKSGVPRVVWSRPKTNHKGPVRRSTQIDQIPFLAVARSLGDLWSYDYSTETYVVSPDPDVAVLPLDPSKHRCLILASDGLWNMLTPEETVHMVMDLENQFEQKIINDPNVAVSFWSNPAERLVARALNKWRSKALKADNTSCVVVLIDPLGPSKLTLLKRKRQELLSGGEIVPSLINKSIASGPVNSSNNNANCSLSDSHLRVTDDSMIRCIETEEEEMKCRIRTSKSRDSYNPANDTCNDSVQYIPEEKSKTTRHVSKPDSMDTTTDESTSMSRIPPKPRTGQDKGTCFTKLVDSSLVPGGKELKEFKRTKASLKNASFSRQNNLLGHLIVDEDIDGFCKDVEIENGSDSEEEDEIPQPPPSTPCSREDKSLGDSSIEDENSLHSSAEAADPAFSLASDESLESPDTSVEARPRTPLSAPAKLTSSRSRRPHLSRSAKRKLVIKPGKKVNIAKAAPGVRGKGPSSPLFKMPLNPREQSVASPRTKVSQRGTTKTSSSTSTSCKTFPSNESTSQFQSPPKQVLNMSKTMNEANHTPKSKRNTITCTGLTPEMSLLLNERKSVLHPASSINADITTHFYPTLRSKDNNSIIADTEESFVSQQEPLKQLNKTGPLRKNGSKRWNFFRSSKLGIDSILGHKKGSEKRNTVSTSKLESELQKNSKVSSTRNTSMSTSKLGDLSLVHLPDVTVSSLHADDADLSALTTGDLTNLSALSAGDSILFNQDDACHHSMQEDVPDGKTGKHRKGFLQKTRFTLSRARKAAKKAFFPENHRLFHHKSTVKKRKSDEFLPTPDMKKRRHIEADC